MVILAVAAFLTLSFFMSSLGGHDTARIPHGHELSTAGSEGSTPAGKTNLGAISEDVLHGGAIAPKLENATAKYVSHPAFPLHLGPARPAAHSHSLWIPTIAIAIAIANPGVHNILQKSERTRGTPRARARERMFAD